MRVAVAFCVYPVTVRVSCALLRSLGKSVLLMHVFVHVVSLHVAHSCLYSPSLRAAHVD